MVSNLHKVSCVTKAELGLFIGASPDEGSSEWVAPVPLALWHLSEPSPDGERRSPGRMVLDYFGPEPPVSDGDPIWLFPHAGGTLGPSWRFALLRSINGDFGECSLLLEGDSEHLWGVRYLLEMLSDVSPSMSVAFLRTERQRWGWLAAASRRSAMVTPWLWEDVDTADWPLAIPVPSSIELLIEPSMFRSESIFYSQVGERSLGLGGYLGASYYWFKETAWRLATVAESFEVTILDPASCQSVAGEFIGPDFYRHIVEILEKFVEVKLSNVTEQVSSDWSS